MPGGNYSSDESEGEEEDDELTDSGSDSDDSIATATQRNHVSSRTREIVRRPNQVAGLNPSTSARKRCENIDITTFQRIFTVNEVIRPQPHPKDPVRVLF
jgi:hypothetical protein